MIALARLRGTRYVAVIYNSCTTLSVMTALVLLLLLRTALIIPAWGVVVTTIRRLLCAVLGGVGFLTCFLVRL